MSNKGIYKNPPLELSQRESLMNESRDFKLMMQMIHEELSNDKDCTIKYCADCHIILTRAANKLHSTCKSVFSSASIAGINN